MLTIGERNPAVPRARSDMVGPQFDFPREKLVNLYGNHRGYMSALKRELLELRREGRYLPMYQEEGLAAGAASRARFE